MSIVVEHRPGKVVRTLRAIHGRSYPRIIGNFREFWWLFYETILPVFGTIAFVYVYRALGAPERFTGYVIMGGATAAFWLNVMWMMASQLWWEKKDGNLELYLIAPSGLVPILLGMSVGGIVMAMVRATAVVVVGTLLFHVHYTIHQLWLFLLIFLVAVVALYGLGMMLSSIFLMWGRESWHTTNAFIEPVYLVAGFYFPVRALGFWVGIGASIIPLTLALDGMRKLLYPTGHHSLLSPEIELGILAGLAVFFIFGARLSLRKMLYLARREGRLGLRE